MNKKLNRRIAQRVETCNLISQETFDEDGAVTSNSMGIAFNISKTGILLQTAHQLSSGYVSLVTSDLNDNLIEIKGKVVYSQKTQEGKYESGISFMGRKEEKKVFSQKLIRVFCYRKNGHFSKVA